MFLTNKYTEWYFALMSKAQQRNTPTGYVERHHILPKSLYPDKAKDKSNIVPLTAKEHYIAHLLLTKMCTGKAFYQMTHALCRMAFSCAETNNRPYITSINYALIRKIMARATSERSSIVVSCYDDNGNRVKTFPSTLLAAKEFNINDTTIHGSLKSKNKWNKAVGYHWRSGCSETTEVQSYSGRKDFKHSEQTKFKLGKPVCQYTLNGVFVATYKTAVIAADITNTPKMSICDVLKGRQQTAGGFIWCYENDLPNLLPNLHIRNRILQQLDLNRNLVKEWSSIKEACAALGIKHISHALKKLEFSAGGFRWQWAAKA